MAPDSGRLPSIPENVSGDLRGHSGRGEEVRKPGEGSQILWPLASSVPLCSSEEPNGAGGGGDRRQHRGAIRCAPGRAKGPAHLQKAEHREAGPPGRGGAEAWLGPWGRDHRDGFLALTPVGETRGQSPGSAPVKVRVELNPGSTFMGEIRAGCAVPPPPASGALSPGSTHYGPEQDWLRPSGG